VTRHPTACSFLQRRPFPQPKSNTRTCFMIGKDFWISSIMTG